MKAIPYFLLALVLLAIVFFSKPLWAGTPDREIKLNAVTLLNGTENLFQSGDYYLGGQPSVETIKKLKEREVTLVINLRSDKEMEGLAESDFKEDSLVLAEGMIYKSLAMEGKQAFNPEILAEFAKILDETEGKVFIHCYGCYRVSYLMMAWLIEYKNYPMEDVLSFGKEMKYFSPLEGLLGRDIGLAL